MEARDYLSKLELGALQSFENMAAFPLRFSGNGGPEYITLKEALDKFVDETQKSVNGTVKVKLHKGHCIGWRDISYRFDSFHLPGFVKEVFDFACRCLSLYIGDDFNLVFPDLKKGGKVKGDQGKG